MNSPRDLERLRERYAAMSDAELQQLADASAELTEDAETALIEELSRRHIEIPELEVNTDELPEYSRRVTLRAFLDLSEALLAKGKLEAAGIRCELPDVNMARMNWFWSNMLGGVRLQVAAEDFARAASVLGEPIPDSLDVEGVGEVEQPRCPKCNSLDVAYQAIDKPTSVAAMFINLPIPIPADRWKCNACGQYWQDVPE
ncbi:MAG: hypothetical protein ACRD3E_12000 [Terriglobales bacterium]